jgi:glutathione S-transferase
MMLKPELISFKICPYVQRAAILLNEKAVTYDITYIDLKHKPDWFLQISPLGKVPVLKVGDAVLFESMVICEYLDEVNPPSLHPAASLRKAENRGWIEYSSELFVDLYRLCLAPDAAECDQRRATLRGKLERLEAQLATGPFFNGPDLALIDVAIAPAFYRLDLLQELQPLGLLAQLPKLQAWSAALLDRGAVRDSVVPEFRELFRDFLVSNGSFVAKDRVG